MNCEHVEKLLPLYVGRDLEDKRAKLVSAHVESCAECASLADEYRETRKLLQVFSPPPVSEAVYAGIRQRVLREIGREPEPAALPRLLTLVFGPRLGWAVATMVLIAVSALAFYFIANRRPILTIDEQQLAGNSRAVERTTPDDRQVVRPGPESAVTPSYSLKENDRPQRASTGRNRSRSSAIARSADQTNGGSVPSDAVDSRTPAAVDTPDVRSLAAGASLGNNLAEHNTSPMLDSTIPEKTLRVEMQTKDRNIRIIWFSHPPTKQNSPGKSFKAIPEVRSDV
jgi:hypothetical protein